MPFLLPFLISHLMCCVKVYYLSWTFLSLKLKKRKGDRGGGESKRGGGGRREEEEKTHRGPRHQLSFARSIKLLDFEMFSGGAHFLRLRVVNGA